MLFGEEWFFARLTLIVPLLLSLAVHEWAHAWTARRLGDDTAERLGRLTLNPLAHLDPIGTVLLPILGIPFGWAKPVPINPVRFAPTVSLRTGIVLTAAAGPLSNLCIALFGLFAVAALSAFEPALAAKGAPARMLLEWSVALNLLLALFNALPIPPLDGSRLVDGIISDGLRPAWDRFAATAPFALVTVLIVPYLFGWGLLTWPVEQALGMIAELATVRPN